MNYVACDIGASSGRLLVGALSATGRIELKELYRFENECKDKNGFLCWDTQALYRHILEGLKLAKPYAPVSFGVDTWGVDFVLLDPQGGMIGDAVAYRDGRTQGLKEALEKRLPFGDHFSKTGIAAQPFNTVYQMMSIPTELLDQAASFLMLPDYLHFLLTGQKRNEYTNASTSGLLNARTRTWDGEVLAAAGLPQTLFQNAPALPGTLLGDFLPEVAAEIGYPCRVVLPATHDTASAFMAVPALDPGAVFLSSGTWSLLGVELDAPLTSGEALRAGFTNEGGHGHTIRFLKNIMGLWILQRLRKEQGGKYTFAEMALLAQENAACQATFDVNAARFLAPESMTREIAAALSEGGQPLPQTDGALFACVYHSLVKCYGEAVKQLESITGKRFTSMNIVGGGSQNQVLNQWIANELCMPVHAGPTEGSSIGNILAQMLAAGEFSNLPAARQAIVNSFEMTTYLPKMKGEQAHV